MLQQCWKEKLWVGELEGCVGGGGCGVNEARINYSTTETSFFFARFLYTSVFTVKWCDDAIYACCSAHDEVVYIFRCGQTHNRVGWRIHMSAAPRKYLAMRCLMSVGWERKVFLWSSNPLRRVTRFPPTCGTIKHIYEYIQIVEALRHSLMAVECWCWVSLCLFKDAANITQSRLQH